MLSNAVISYNKPRSPAAEAYRVLRTNIQFSGLDTSLKTVLVTSSIPMEGKTTISENLAVTLAQSGSRVLLLDADLRKSSIHKMFDLPRREGLTNILVEQRGFQEYIIDVGMENLDFIASGPVPPNPCELLGSSRMKQFIEQVSVHYDMILLDSPPVGTFADAAVLSTLADGVLLVAGSGRVSIDMLAEAKEKLERVNAHIIGVILNKVEKSRKDQYDYYAQEGEDLERGTARRQRRKKGGR